MPQADMDASYNYYIGLIKLALAKAKVSNNYIIKPLSTVLSQGRAELELLKKDGVVNIYPMGTSIEREKNLLPIRIPLLKGTLGLRILIIHRDNLEKFKQVSTLKDLQQFTACQGAHWPDSDILEDAGLTVIRNSSFEGMYQQLKQKHCDYFPRSIIEAYAEIRAYRQKHDDDLQVYDGFMLSYAFPMYFFVSPHEKKIAIDIKQGLQQAILDGSFNQYFKNNPITKQLFPLNQWNNRKRIHLFNRYLSPETPLTNKKLWLFSFKQ